jgi:cysteine desulfurase
MSARTAIYLDANAGAPLKPAALLAIQKAVAGTPGAAFSFVPNPSSIHSHGRLAKRWLAEAREKIARSLGHRVDVEQLVFTSSGTEANQLAIRSVLEARLERGEKPHWITTSIEHDSALQMAEWLLKRGGTVSFLPVSAQGRVDVSQVVALLKPETALVSAMWVNNETGVITDMAELVREVRKSSSPVTLHVDAAQAWGKLPLDLTAMGADLVTFSSHKIGALAGSGLVWVARGTPLSALIRGKQEKGRRGGTENLLGIMAMGAAAADLDPLAWAARVAPLRDQLQRVISERLSGTRINGEDAPRVANTLNVSFDGVEGDGLVMAMDLAGYSVSSGSACSSGVLEPSHVLMAMGRTEAQAMSALRVSLVDEMPWHVLEGFVGALEKAVQRVRVAQ